MHEMALVRNVVDIVVEKAEASNVREVRAVHIVIGEGRDVVEEYFEGLFRYLARGTVAQRAEVILYRMPYMVRCNQCGFVFHVDVFDQESWSCPACEAYQEYKLVSGLEFYVSRIEVVGTEGSESRPSSPAGQLASAPAIHEPGQTKQEGRARA